MQLVRIFFLRMNISVGSNNNNNNDNDMRDSREAANLY